MREYKLIRSSRRTLALEIGRDLTLTVRAPMKMPLSDIEAFVQKHDKWIEKKLSVMEKREIKPDNLSAEEIAALKKKAKEILPQKVAYFSEIMGLKPANVKITSAKKRFGSCSGKNSLCFSYQLMLYPDEAIDYVVVHELAHIKHRNHSARFYSLIEKYLPDYKTRERILKSR